MNEHGSLFWPSNSALSTHQPTRTVGLSVRRLVLLPWHKRRKCSGRECGRGSLMDLTCIKVRRACKPVLQSRSDGWKIFIWLTQESKKCLLHDGYPVQPICVTKHSLPFLFTWKCARNSFQIKQCHNIDHELKSFREQMVQIRLCLRCAAKIRTHFIDSFKHSCLLNSFSDHPSCHSLQICTLYTNPT